MALLFGDLPEAGAEGFIRHSSASPVPVGSRAGLRQISYYRSLEGESGTGKELVARQVHELSRGEIRGCLEKMASVDLCCAWPIARMLSHSRSATIASSPPRLTCSMRMQEGSRALMRRPGKTAKEQCQKSRGRQLGRQTKISTALATRDSRFI